MKINDIYNELVSLAKRAGITVRKEKGSFRSGYCVLKDEELIVLNPNNTMEILSSTLAKSLTERSIDNAYIKPVIRDFIEKERQMFPENNQEFVCEIM